MSTPSTFIDAHGNRYQLVNPAPKPITAEDRASIVQHDYSADAAMVARHFVNVQALPANSRSAPAGNWRNSLKFAHGKLPADVIDAFGLNEFATWADVLRACERILKPRPLADTPHGWEKGAHPRAGSFAPQPKVIHKAATPKPAQAAPEISEADAKDDAKLSAWKNATQGA